MINRYKRKIDTKLAKEFSSEIHKGDTGYITLAVKNKDGIWKEKHIKNVAAFSKEMDRCYATKSDVYMSINSWKYPSRNIDYIKTINAIYIDIDYHPNNDAKIDKNISKIHTKYITETILNSLVKKNKIPAPNIINLSGRGLHLYWLINPVDKTKILEHNVVSKHICNIISEHLKSIKSSYRVDSSISQDIARVMRLAGTYNQKTGSRCECSIEHDKRYDLSELRQRYGLNSTKRKTAAAVSKSANSTISTLPVAKPLYAKRMKDLETLVYIRYRENRDIWARKRILFLYRHFAICCGYSYDEALIKTYKLNNYFKEPLKEKLVERITSSGQKRIENGKHYRYNNASLIKLLDITEDEYEKLTTILPKEILAERKKERRRKNYGNRDNNGFTEKQREMLADRLKVAEYRKEGYSIAETASITGLSLSKVKRLRAEIKAADIELGAPYNNIKNEIIIIYKRNFNREYLKQLVCSFLRPSINENLIGNPELVFIHTLLEQISYNTNGNWLRNTS